MDSLATNSFQNVDLVVRDSSKNEKQGIALLLMKACFKEKIGNTHTSTGLEVILK